MNNHIPLQKIAVSAYRIPTESPESDGTLAWDSTTLVLVEASAGGKTGIGYSYADRASAVLAKELLAPLLNGANALDVPGQWLRMVAAIRNLGRPGIASMAIAAVDVALWDLKAKLLDLPLVSLLGAVRESVAIYGSGGFTSYSVERLQQQLGGWAQQGIPRMKMKIGREPAQDVARVAAAREAIGDSQLFVDANGAYCRKQALAMAEAFANYGVVWFEEPVSSDDLDGLRLLRDRAPAGMEVSAGEYGYALPYFERMLAHGAVDVLQADATRCAGITGFLSVGPLCQARSMPMSSHCAPGIHLHPCCALPPLRHMEYFFDHVRIENMLFDGVVQPSVGELRPDLSRPGLGLEFRHADARPYAI
ncbi:MAG TPA: enolase C-terminal domain-like protein [Methylophilaceae bacterium]|nr:enolase C-terminal domain-like protein [Methylophilaceae bacterium]